MRGRCTQRSDPTTGHLVRGWELDIREEGRAILHTNVGTNVGTFLVRMNSTARQRVYIFSCACRTVVDPHPSVVPYREVTVVVVTVASVTKPKKNESGEGF